MPIRLATFTALVTVLLTLPAAFAESPADFHANGYYLARHDLRLCPAPECGGWFVKSLNRQFTRCADGTLQSECYVAALRKAPDRLSRGSAEIVLQGKIHARTYEGIGDFGEFLVLGAWVGATEGASSGRHVGVENNGIVCFTTPCFSIDQHLLNRSLTRSVSKIDLSQVNASQDVEDAAINIMANGGVLLAAGVNHQVADVSGIGLMFVATQFYLPVP